MNIGDTIRELRKQRGYSQESLSRAMEVSQSAIASYESGARTPSVNMMKRFAAFFSVPASTFLPDSHADQDTVQAIADALHQNPDLRVLFDKTRKMSRQDIKAVLSIVNAITKERDGE